MSGHYWPLTNWLTFWITSHWQICQSRIGVIMLTTTSCIGEALHWEHMRSFRNGITGIQKKKRQKGNNYHLRTAGSVHNSRWNLSFEPGCFLSFIALSFLFVFFPLSEIRGKSGGSRRRRSKKTTTCEQRAQSKAAAGTWILNLAAFYLSSLHFLFVSGMHWSFFRDGRQVTAGS